MAAHNRLWGAERIRGELLKLDLRVRKRTIQKDMKQIRPKRARGQNWKPFLRHHTAEVWSGDFLQVTDLFFRSLFAYSVCVFIEQDLACFRASWQKTLFVMAR